MPDRTDQLFDCRSGRVWQQGVLPRLYQSNPGTMPEPGTNSGIDQLSIQGRPGILQDQQFSMVTVSWSVR